MLPASFRVARFVARFGWAAYQNSYWAQFTSDGVLPFRMLAVWERQLDRLQAGDEMVATFAVAGGAGLALGGDTPAVTRRLISRAIPAFRLPTPQP